MFSCHPTIVVPHRLGRVMVGMKWMIPILVWYGMVWVVCWLTHLTVGSDRPETAERPKPKPRRQTPNTINTDIKQ